jgi:hypothetical protein
MTGVGQKEKRNTESTEVAQQTQKKPKLLIGIFCAFCGISALSVFLAF